MEIRMEITGVTPIILHNPRLSDPLDYYTKEIAKISKKTRKSEDDHAEIARLEFLGGLYTDHGHVVLPTANLRKCIIQAGKATKQGKQIERAVVFREQFVELEYEGPTEIEKLFNANGTFVDRCSVVVSNRRIIRVRPKFFPWMVQVTAITNDQMLNPEDFERIVTLAGQIEGLCDGRAMGYGRFEVEFMG